MQLASKDLGLICVFAALYAVFTLVPLFPVVGVPGASIGLAGIMAPLMGLILGPYIGALAVSIGGVIGWSVAPQFGAFSFLSFLPGFAASLSSGLLYKRVRKPSVAIYSVLFLSLAFYPSVGPAWLYPSYLWFQLAGLLILISPLTPKAAWFMEEKTNSFKLSFGILIICLASTLTGQMTGNLLYEFMYRPTMGQWQVLTFVYPFERIIIAFVATIIGVPLIKALNAYGFKIGGNKESNAVVRHSYQVNKAS